LPSFDFGTEFTQMATAFAGKRRVVVTEPRAGRNQGLNAFGSALADSLRRSLMSQKKFTVVDPESVDAALAVSRVRSDVEKSLKPDLLISPSLVGAGESMTVLVTVRDVRSGVGNNARVASARIALNNPEAAIPGLVKGVNSQIDNLLRSPAIIRMRPNVRRPPARDQ
jgi:hypothetical protein